MKIFIFLTLLVLGTAIYAHADDDQPVHLMKKCTYINGIEDCGYYMYQCVKFCKE